MKRTLLVDLCVSLVVVTCGPTDARPVDPALVVLVDGQTLTRVDAAGVTPLFTFGKGNAGFVKIMQWELQGQLIGGFAFHALGDVARSALGSLVCEESVAQRQSPAAARRGEQLDRWPRARRFRKHPRLAGGWQVGAVACAHRRS